MPFIESKISFPPSSYIFSLKSHFSVAKPKNTRQCSAKGGEKKAKKHLD